MEAKEAIKRIEQFGLYHAIKDLPNSHYTVTAFEMAIDALEKQMQKKPNTDKEGRFVCPTCGGEEYCLTFDGVPEYKYNYCTECGQKIDWSGDGT